jgi:hypothetical protein
LPRREKGTAEKVMKEEKKKFAILQGKKQCGRRIIFKSIKGCKHPLIASGATTIGSTWRTPDELAQNNYSWNIEKTVYLSLYPKIF